jgi:hypothetical protein
MRKIALLAVAFLVGSAGLCRADFVFANRFVNVRVGPCGVEVCAPFVRVYVPRGIPVPPPAPVPVPQPMPRIEPVEKKPAAPPVPPQEQEPDLKLAKLASEGQTIYDFATSFKPTPGPHEVTVIHPYTNRPVKLSFSLPEGSPTVQIKGTLRRCIDFAYGKSHREIWFYRDGRVRLNF